MPARTPPNALESGWISGVLPVIYTGQELRRSREWLRANSYGAVGPLSGSFYSADVEDYDPTPWDLSYGHILLDHEFIGRPALQARASQKHRRKVTLVWESQDVAAAFESLFMGPRGHRAEYIALPVSR